mmetsp:Transcript_59895/g.159453  ORF Transcript_59895/g.159453 Transcript_59895/m.159453 type:complete len:429 (-) Transcript_59895:67-1353(-)
MLNLSALQRISVQSIPLLAFNSVGQTRVQARAGCLLLTPCQVAHVCHEGKRGAQRATSHGSVHLARVHKVARSSSPVQRARTELRTPHTHHQLEGWDAGYVRAQAVQLRKSTRKVVRHSQVGSTETLEEECARVALRGYIQNLARVRETRPKHDGKFPEETTDINCNADDDDAREGCLHTSLLPTETQLLQGRIAPTRETGGPLSSLHVPFRQQRRQEVEHTQTQQRGGAHAAPLVALVIQAVFLQRPEEQPRPHNLTDSTGEAALHYLNEPRHNEAQPAKHRPSWPVTVRLQQLVRPPHPVKCRLQLVVLQSGKTVKQLKQSQDKGKGTSHVVIAFREVNIPCFDLLRSGIQQLLRFSQFVSQHETYCFVHGDHVTIPTSQNHRRHFAARRRGMCSVNRVSHMHWPSVIRNGRPVRRTRHAWQHHSA